MNSILSITKAIIVARDLENCRLQVRIPTIDGIPNSLVSPSSDQNLSWASILYFPGLNIEYEVGDIVWVTFEDNEVDQPVVLGYVMLPEKRVESKLYIEARELEVKDVFKAPLESTIGKTSYQELFDAVDSTN